jgi:hypothetical protein
MRTFDKGALALGLIAIVAAPAWSQQPKGRGGSGGRGAGAAALLANKDVQRELKITEVQATKLAAFSTEFGRTIREDMANVRKLPEAERAAKLREVAAGKHHSDMIRALGSILTEEQIKRFEQISLQHAGAAAFATARVQQKLKITDDQKSKIREIEQRSAAAIRKAGESIQGDREGATKKITGLQKETSEQIHALLSDDQRKIWNELTGEPFEVKLEAPASGGGRRAR